MKYVDKQVQYQNLICFFFVYSCKMSNFNIPSKLLRYFDKGESFIEEYM